MSFSQISKKLNIPKTTVFRWFKKQNKPRKEKIKVVCKICKKTFFVPPCRKKTAKYCSKRCLWKDLKKRYKARNAPNWKGVQIKINCIECGKNFIRKNKNNKFCSLKCMGLAERKKIKNKRITKDLVYILGVLKGDGYLQNNSVGLTAKDKDFIDFFAKKIENWSTYKPKILKNNRGYFVCQLYSKEIFDFLRNLDCSQILKTKNDYIEFIKGFFDSEGTINKSNNTISFCNTNYKIISFIHNLLNLFGINSKIYVTYREKRKPKFDIVITSKENQKKFTNLISSSIYRKQRRLDSIANI